jgi:hypothetical protein
MIFTWEITPERFAALAGFVLVSFTMRSQTEIVMQVKSSTRVRSHKDFPTVAK